MTKDLTNLDQYLELTKTRDRIREEINTRNNFLEGFSKIVVDKNLG